MKVPKIISGKCTFVFRTFVLFPKIYWYKGDGTYLRLRNVNYNDNTTFGSFIAHRVTEFSDLEVQRTLCENL
jgi:hypothetical protein